MEAPTLPVTDDGRVVLDADQARSLIAYHAEVARLLDAVNDVLGDMSLTYDTMVPNDATLAVGSIGRVRIADLRRLKRKAADLRQIIGRPRAVNGIKIVTLNYEAGEPS